MACIFNWRAGLLLLAAVLCAFLCWGIVCTVAAEEAIAVQTVAAARSVQELAGHTDHLVRNADGMVLDARAQLQWTQADLQATAANLKRASAGLDVAIEEINRPCPAGDDSAPCGTIATANRALNSLRMAAGQVTAVSRKEEQKLKEANEHETVLATAARDALLKLGAAIDGLRELTTNQDLRQSLKNLNETTGATAGMARDTADWWHRWLNPKWPAKIYGQARSWALPLFKFFVF